MIRTKRKQLAILNKAANSLRQAAKVHKGTGTLALLHLQPPCTRVAFSSPPKYTLPPLTTPKFFINNVPHSSTPDGGKPSKSQQELVNLGNMIDYLSMIIPEALSMTPDPVKLDENIKLRISPSIQPNVPVITGQLKYITSLKATQLIFKNFILNANTKLHVLKMDVVDKDQDCPYGVLKGTTKLIVHWKTCGDNCFHLQGGSAIKSSGHKELKSYDLFHNLINKYWSRYPPEDRNNEFNSKINERVLFGIFVFELNGMNDQILVHSLENLEILHGKDFVDDDVMRLCS